MPAFLSAVRCTRGNMLAKLSPSIHDSSLNTLTCAEDFTHHETFVNVAQLTNCQYQQSMWCGKDKKHTAAINTLCYGNQCGQERHGEAGKLYWQSKEMYWSSRVGTGLDEEPADGAHFYRNKTMRCICRWSANFLPTTEKNPQPYTFLTEH